LLQLVLLIALLGASANPAGVLLRALVDTLDWALVIQLAAIFVRCIVSFFAPAQHNPNMQLLEQVTEPVVRPFRRLVPPLAGLDFSCWFASIALVLIRMLVLAPLGDFALHLT
jgi:YggT family protein